MSSRASDDPEKTTNTYTEESQPAHGKKHGGHEKKKKEATDKENGGRGRTNGDGVKAGVFLSRQHKCVTSIKIL